MKIDFSSLEITLPDIFPAQQIIMASYYILTLRTEDLFFLPHFHALEKSTRKRQSEHLAGRFAACKALAQLGIENFVPGIGAHNEPLWPEGVMGSISHNQYLALAAVSTNSRGGCEGLGLDIEPVINIKKARELAQSIISREEYDVINKSSLPFDKALTLVFSGKESLFKALFKYVRNWLDFSVAAIINIEPQTQQFAFRLTEYLSEEFPEGRIFNGCWHWHENNIITVIRF